MSKIKKNIKGIYFLGAKTRVLFKERFKPRDYNEIITEETPKTSDFTRHRHFNDAMAVMKVHLLVRLGFAEPVDRLGKVITLDNGDFFTDNIYLDDPRFDNIEITSVIVTTKEDATNFKINGIVTTIDGQKSKIYCQPISTLKATDGSWNYPLIDFAQIHLEALLNEAEQWLAYKSDQLKIDFDKVEDASTPAPAKIDKNKEAVTA